MQRSGRAVAAAALIMATVFADFIFTADPIVKSVALALTVGVLLDAFVVRLALVPAGHLPDIGAAGGPAGRGAVLRPV